MQAAQNRNSFKNITSLGFCGTKNMQESEINRLISILLRVNCDGRGMWHVWGDLRKGDNRKDPGIDGRNLKMDLQDLG
jgi:hypothetical protein